MKAGQTPQCNQTNVSKVPIEATAATAAAHAPRVCRKSQWRRRTAHRGPRALAIRVECTWKSCKGWWWPRGRRRRHTVWHTIIQWYTILQVLYQLLLDLDDNCVHICSANRKGFQLILRSDDRVAQLIHAGQKVHLHSVDLIKPHHDLRG